MAHSSLYLCIPTLMMAVSACERHVNPPPVQAPNQPGTQRPAEPQARAVTSQNMPNPKAIVVVWIGPSDRPTPPTVFWSDKAALQSATDWIAKRGHAPIGVTAVETRPDDLPCMAKALPADSGGSLLEVFAWDGAAASSPVSLSAAKSREFLAAAIACVGDATPAAGYLKSLQTLVNNASR